MQKSDFHMTNFLWNEQQFLHGSCGNQISTWAMWKSDFWSLVQLVISRIFWKCMEIYQWPSLILTHTGIRDFRMSRMSGIEISSSQGLKKPPKMSPREEKAYLPRAAGPREVSFFFPRAYFKVFYNPRDEEISIPDINGHSENLFLFEFIYVQNLFFFPWNRHVHSSSRGKW